MKSGETGKSRQTRNTSVAEELFKHAVKATYNQKKHSAAMFVEQLDRERINHGDTIKDVSHTFRVRNHEVSVARSSAVEEMRMVDRMTFERRGRKPELRKQEADYSWLWWIGGLGLLWLFLSE